MKGSVAVFIVLLIAASFSQTFSAPDGPDLPDCCYSYTSHKLPKRLISRHYSTSSSCSLRAVVFVTKKGVAVCANPSDPWVQSHLRNSKQN
ncbi:CCL14 protein, partial [Eudromia elegans]|nr:CCL14 protein [Eudromia elegans]